VGCKHQSTEAIDFKFGLVLPVVHYSAVFAAAILKNVCHCVLLHVPAIGA